MPTRRLLLAGCALLAAMPAAAQTVPPGGPLSLLITYRAAPADRPAFRTYLAKDEAVLLAGLKREGVLKSWKILYNPVVGSGTWDAMTVLTFTRFSETKRWMEIETSRPGGLDAAGLKIAKPVDTYAADLPWEGEARDPGAERDAVYYIIPYEYNDGPQYRTYVDGYVVPQVKGWMGEGVLAGYQLFMNRYQTGRPWDSLFVYRYRDLEAFGHRDETTAKVRKGLVADPAWKHWSDIKQTLRSESENTIAQWIAGG